MIDHPDGLDYMAFCFAVFGAPSGISGAESRIVSCNIHEPISKLILRMYRPVTNRAQKDGDNDLQIGVAVGAVHRMIHRVLFR